MFLLPENASSSANRTLAVDSKNNIFSLPHSNLSKYVFSWNKVGRRISYWCQLLMKGIFVLKSLSKQLSLRIVVLFAEWVTVSSSLSFTIGDFHSEIKTLWSCGVEVLVPCDLLLCVVHHASPLIPSQQARSCPFVPWETHVEEFPFHRGWW